MSNIQEIINHQVNDNTIYQVLDQVSDAIPKEIEINDVETTEIEIEINEAETIEIENVPEITLIEKFFQVYNSDYRPPSWVTKMDPTPLDELWKCTKIYFNSKDNASSTQENVKDLVEKREPVNMDCWRGYNLELLEKLFGYKTSSYGALDHSVNLACLVKTPIEPFGNEVAAENQEQILVNILNVIAPAFDSLSQPDYHKYFRHNGQPLIEEIVKRYQLIFTMIFECAISEGMEVVYLTGCGLGAFRNDPADFADGFNLAYNKYAEKLNELGIKLYFWDYNQNMYNNLTIMCPAMSNVEFAMVNNRELYSYVLKISQTINIAKVLFINLWDMFSNLGNGNAGDNSWDGQWGRRTAISILALPQFNKYIEYVDIDIFIELPKIIEFNEAATNDVVTNDVMEVATEVVSEVMSEIIANEVMEVATEVVSEVVVTTVVETD